MEKHKRGSSRKEHRKSISKMTSPLFARRKSFSPASACNNRALDLSEKSSPPPSPLPSTSFFRVRVMNIQIDLAATKCCVSRTRMEPVFQPLSSRPRSKMITRCKSRATREPLLRSFPRRDEKYPHFVSLAESCARRRSFPERNETRLLRLLPSRSSAVGVSFAKNEAHSRSIDILFMGRGRRNDRCTVHGPDFLRAAAPLRDHSLGKEGEILRSAVKSGDNGDAGVRLALGEQDLATLRNSDPRETVSNKRSLGGSASRDRSLIYSELRRGPRFIDIAVRDQMRSRWFFAPIQTPARLFRCDSDGH